jgi:hypothetical protein
MTRGRRMANPLSTDHTINSLYIGTDSYLSIRNTYAGVSPRASSHERAVWINTAMARL